MTASAKAQKSATAHVRHNFSVSPETVFDAWLDANMLARWMFHPDIRQEEVISLTLDAQKGGSFRFIIRQGEQTCEYYGTYYDVNRPKHLIFSWISARDHKKTLVSVTLEKTQTGCELNLIHELGDCAEEFIRFVEARWQAEFDVLSKMVN